jgi:D-glycero-beta-D-manno-heptose 1-phosphate adenylyltransferase
LPTDILNFSASKDVLVPYLWPEITALMCAAFSTASKIVTRADLQRWVTTWRLKNSRIVFTNGVFDILHLGHVDYLEKARGLGDVLVVGVNADASVRRLNKGDERPLQAEESRARVMAGLACVDAVCLFHEDTPLELIVELRPDVLVKGDDYTLDQIVGGKEVTGWGGAVQTIPLVPGHGTTLIVNKIKRSNG